MPTNHVSGITTVLNVFLSSQANIDILEANKGSNKEEIRRLRAENKDIRLKLSQLVRGGAHGDEVNKPKQLLMWFSRRKISRDAAGYLGQSGRHTPRMPEISRNIVKNIGDMFLCWHGRWRSSTTPNEKYIAFEKCTTTTGAGEQTTHSSAEALALRAQEKSKRVDALRSHNSWYNRKADSGLGKHVSQSSGALLMLCSPLRCCFRSSAVRKGLQQLKDEVKDLELESRQVSLHLSTNGKYC